MNNNIYAYLILLFFLYSCRFNCPSWKIEDLGNNFVIAESNIEFVEMLFCIEPECCRRAVIVVPSKIIEYDSDSLWIIAKSTNEREAKVDYWVINKHKKIDLDKDLFLQIKSCIIGPLDSLIFVDEIKSNNINLQLKKYGIAE